MADSIKSSFELSVGLDYLNSDNKDKTVFIKIPNPKSNLTESEIRTAVGTFINSQIVFDPMGNAFSTSSIATAYTTNEEKIDIDIDG